MKEANNTPGDNIEEMGTKEHGGDVSRKGDQQQSVLRVIRDSTDTQRAKDRNSFDSKPDQ